jgi:hypothetical protein
LMMFEPRTFPTESAAPPDRAAIRATVSSGSEVEKAIMLNPTAVFPSWVTLDTFNAFFIARLLAQFSTAKETAMIMMLMMKSVTSNSAIVSAFFVVYSYFF